MVGVGVNDAMVSGQMNCVVCSVSMVGVGANDSMVIGQMNCVVCSWSITCLHIWDYQLRTNLRYKAVWDLIIANFV